MCAAKYRFQYHEGKIVVKMCHYMSITLNDTIVIAPEAVMRETKPKKTVS